MPGARRISCWCEPRHHPLGDFALKGDRVGQLPSIETVEGDDGAYSGIGVYAPAFADSAPGRQPLKPILDEAITRALSGELYEGMWEDVTRLSATALNQKFPSD